MNPVEPRPVENTVYVTFAKDQPEYIPLTACVDGYGTVVTEWEPTAEELAFLMEGGRVRLTLLYALYDGEQKKMRALSPIKLEVAP